MHRISHRVSRVSPGDLRRRKGGGQKMQYRIGNFVRTDEESFVNLDHIMEVRIEPLGDTNDPRTWQKDEYEVQIVLANNDMWLPDKTTWTEGPKHSGHLQMSEMQMRDVAKGTKAECESIVAQILGVSSIASKEAVD